RSELHCSGLLFTAGTRGTWQFFSLQGRPSRVSSAPAVSCQRWHKIVAMLVVRRRLSAEAAEAPRLLFDCLIWPQCPRRARPSSQSLDRQIGVHMHAIVQRYEGIDTRRTNELTRKAGASLTPRLRKLVGFGGYYFLEGLEGALIS